MSVPEPLIRNISDTARWVAVYRARESERPDAIFRDPFARRLAGKRGEEIAAGLGKRAPMDWPFVTRTYLFDTHVWDHVRAGGDMVVNLAAGLDTRPYRMDLPSGLRWVEIDLPEILEYKEEILSGETPRCRLERLRVDLADRDARRPVFAGLGMAATNALILTEGLITYLSEEQVAGLAEDLAAAAGFRRWAIDMVTRKLREILMKDLGPTLEAARAPFRFSPGSGPDFFRAHGWNPVDVRSSLKWAATIGRLSFGLRLLALIPDSKGKNPSTPWGGVVLLARQAP